MTSKYIIITLLILSGILLQPVALAEQSISSWPSLTNHVLLPPDGQKADAFHMVVIGDSVAWGNGLNDQDKYYYLVADWLQKKLNRPIDIAVYAHSGASISGEIGKSIDPNLNSVYPTLMDQANNIQNKDKVDLILVSGGINDVGVFNIINPYIPSDEIAQRAQSTKGSMEILLTYLLDKCNNAKIVVTDYYSIVSEDSDTKLIMGAYDLGIFAVNTVLNKDTLDGSTAKERLTENSAKFHEGSTTAITNAILDSDDAANRIVLANVNFEPENSYAASETWLWKFIAPQASMVSILKTDDDQFDYRSSLASDPVDKINAVGHPNRDGAKEYALAIESAINSKGLDWLQNNATPSGASDTQPSPQETGLPLTTTQEPKMLNISSDPEAVAFSHDGSKLAISASQDQSTIWDVASGTKLQTLNDGWYSGGLRSFAFSPDDSKLAIGIIGEAQTTIWDVNSGEKLQWMDSPSYLTAFSTDGSKLITCDFYNSISIWDVARGTKLQTLNTESTYFKALSLDGSKMATSNDADRTTRIWDVASGTKLQEIKHNHPVIFVAFNFDGSKLATSSEGENKSEIWDVNSGEKLQDINFDKDADRPLGPLAFSPDGSKLATYHSGVSNASIFPVFSIRIWDLNSGVMLQKLNSGASRASAGPWAVAFSPDGSRLTTGGAIWDIATSASKKSVAEELPASVVASVTDQNTTSHKDASEPLNKSPGYAGILAIAALLCIFILCRKD